MGLDMYLYAEKHISQYDYEQNSDGKMSRRDNLEYDKANLLVSGMPTGEYGGITITKCVGYWRKANAVHGWIVSNLADGEDTCQKIPVALVDLMALRLVCLQGLASRDEAVPTLDPQTFDGSSESFDTLAEHISKALHKESHKINTVKDSNDHDPIPPVAGFFFGGTEKDEYYYSYLANTVETINLILAGDPNGDYGYYYQASW